MARIRLTIDYSPRLGDYPDDVTTKKEAMEFDLNQVYAGSINPADLLEFADDISYEILDD